MSGSTEDGVLPGFEVVEMGSRPGDDMALGSGGVTTTTWPDCDDHIVNYTSHSASSQLDHSGGFQVLGRYAVLALESTNDSTKAGFMIADLNDPEMRPRVLQQLAQDGIRCWNISAGGGAYVDSMGRMIVYGVEHYDDAYPNDGFGVKVREFVTNY